MAKRLFPETQALVATCQRHKISRLSLFGSTLKGTDRPDSDVDLLVEFEPGARITLLDMAQIEIELSTLLGGRTRPPNNLRSQIATSNFLQQRPVRRRACRQVVDRTVGQAPRGIRAPARGAPLAAVRSNVLLRRDSQ